MTEPTDQEYETTGDPRHDVAFLKGRLYSLETSHKQLSDRTDARFQHVEETWGERLINIERKVDALVEMISVGAGSRKAYLAVAGIILPAIGAALARYDDWLPLVLDYLNI